MSAELTGGQMAWAAAVAGPLRGATCLWQDLDGLHRSAPPPDAPPTSILWGWRDDALIRVRLDGDTAFVAVLALAPAVGGVRTVPWDPADGRVAAVRGPAALSGAVEQVVIEGRGDATGAITFVRPTRGCGE